MIIEPTQEAYEEYLESLNLDGTFFEVDMFARYRDHSVCEVYWGAAQLCIEDGYARITDERGELRPIARRRAYVLDVEYFPDMSRLEVTVSKKGLTREEKDRFLFTDKSNKEREKYWALYKWRWIA